MVEVFDLLRRLVLLRDLKGRLLIRPRECLQRNLASNEVTICKILHLHLILLIDLVLFLIYRIVVLLSYLRWFLQVLGVYFQLFEWSCFRLLLCYALSIQVGAESLVEVLATDLSTYALRLVSSF